MELIWPVCKKKSQLCYRKKHDGCKNVSNKCECDCHVSKKKDRATKEEWLLTLLKRQDANIGMICAFVKTNQHTAKQLIVNLRKKGNNISLLGYGGFYHLTMNKKTLNKIILMENK